MGTTLLKGGSVFTMDSNRTCYHPGYVLIENNRIAQVGKGEPDSVGPCPDEVIDVTGQAVFPGFINIHSHAVLTALRGRAEDVDTLTAVYGLMAPMNEAVTPEDSYAMARLGLWDMLRTGVSTVVESSAHMEAVAEAARSLGIRAYLVAGKIHDAVLPRVLQGTYEFDSNLGNRTLTQAMDFADEWSGRANGRLQCMLGPHATDTCSRDLWDLVSEQARAKGLGVTTHVLQNTQELEQVKELHGFLPVELLEDVGVLNERLIAAHCIHISAREINRMALAQATLAHCPAILAKRGYTAPLVSMLEEGVNVALGTDNMSGDMVEAMRYALTSARIRESCPDFPKPDDIMDFATTGGARALGRANDLGSIEAGCLADITVVDYRAPHTTPVFPDTQIPVLVHCGRGGDISTVLVDGQVVIKNGSLQTANEDQILADAQRAAAGILERIRS